ncbi:MAG TPA: hypothetical protein VHV51_16785 [Polyangiaceae bacterium]|jgi:hypothetical protein|nr:hypothetical protein [Polyangiaceae bacterium]
MRLSKALWFTAFAGFMSIAPAIHAQTTASAADKTKTAAGPAASAKAAAAAPAPAASATVAAPAASASATTTAAAPATAAPSAGASSAPAAPMDGSTYVVRLRDLEQHIDELKEQIRRSHTRLSLLSDTILSGGAGGARAEINFKNDLSSAFRLTGALFVLDGAVQYNKQDESDDSALSQQKEIPVFSGSIPPGDHTVQIVLQLRGNGYGVFSYLKGYKFKVPSSHSFTITEGKTLRLDVIAWEKGDVTTNLEDRPAVRFIENIRSGIAADAAPAGNAAPSAAPAAPVSGSASVGVSVGTGAK